MEKTDGHLITPSSPIHPQPAPRWSLSTTAARPLRREVTLPGGGGCWDSSGRDLEMAHATFSVVHVEEVAPPCRPAPPITLALTQPCKQYSNWAPRVSAHASLTG